MHFFCLNKMGKKVYLPSTWFIIQLRGRIFSSIFCYKTTPKNKSSYLYQENIINHHFGGCHTFAECADFIIFLGKNDGLLITTSESFLRESRIDFSLPWTVKNLLKQRKEIAKIALDNFMFPDLKPNTISAVSGFKRFHFYVRAIETGEGGDLGRSYDPILIRGARRQNRHTRLLLATLLDLKTFFLRQYR